MAKPPVKKKAVAKRKKPTKASIKKVVQQRLTKKNKAEWETKSHKEQTEYLKEHPDSKYKKLGVTKKAEENEQSNTSETGTVGDDVNKGESTTPNTDGSNSIDERTNEPTSNTEDSTSEKVVEAPSTKEEPLVPASDPKEPLLKRVKTGLSGIFKIDPKRIMEDAKEGYQEGLREALTKPETHEEIKKRLEEYLKEPPKKAKDGLDLKTLAIGAAAILAIGGLALAAPGLAIVVGLQLADKAPELMGQLNERANRKREEAKENEEKDAEDRLQKHDMVSQQLADIIGDTVGSHMENDEDLHELVRKAVEKDSNEEQSPEEPTSKPEEQPPITEDTKSGEDTNKETEAGKEDKTTDNVGEDSTNVEQLNDELEDEFDDEFDDEDDDDVYEDDDEEEDEDEEPAPPPKKRSKTKVKAGLLSIVSKAFDSLDLSSTEHDKTIEKIVAEIKEKESTGTYAALKLHPSSARLLNKWAVDKGIKNPFAAGDMHITVCYSRKPVDYKPLSFIHGAREVKPKDLGLLGREEDKKMLVLHLEDSGFPQRRFNYAKSIGASHDFPEYLPHISIAPPGHGIDDPSEFNFDGFNFPLLVDYEYYNELHASDAMRDIPSEGYITNKPNPVKASIAENEGTLKNKAGEVLSYKKGDMLLSDASGDTWPVKANIFKSKYKKQEDGTYEKGKINYSYKVHEGNKPLTIQTLEGPVVANKGDVIITGTTGEQWPIPRSRFNELYSVVVDSEILAYSSL